MEIVCGSRVRIPVWALSFSFWVSSERSFGARVIVDVSVSVDVGSPYIINTAGPRDILSNLIYSSMTS